MKTPSYLLPGLRSFRLATTPLAALLLTVQTFHGELLQAQQMANTNWSLDALPSLTPPPDDLPAGLDPTGAHATSPHGGIPHTSPGRQAEIMEQAQAEQFHFYPHRDQPGAWRAANPGHRLSLVHAADGLTITPRPDPLGPATPGWEVRYEAESLVLDATRHPLPAVSPSALENQSSADRLPGCNEWFRNTEAGLQHGFTIQQPQGEQPSTLAVEIAVHTGLTPSYDATRDTVEFRDLDQRVVLGYRTLLVVDRTGRELPSQMSLDHSGTVPVISLSCDVGDAEFPLVIDPFSYSQNGLNRMPGDVAPGDNFGGSSAGLGDHAVIGAPLKGNGAVYVYHRNEGGTDNFGQVAKLEVPAAESPGTEDQFGSAVTFVEDEATGTVYLAVGAQQHSGCGSVFIFYLAVTGWLFLERLQPAGLTLGAFFGCSLAAFGTLIAVGALAQNGRGAVFLFTLLAAAFTLFQIIIASDGAVGDNFGAAVALAATLLIIGAPGRVSETGGFARAGAAYAFTRAAVGALFGLGFTRFFNNTPGVDQFMGSSVAVIRNTIAIGIPGSGKVVLWRLLLTGWIFLTPLFGPAGSNFGAYMFMNYFGDLVVGAPLLDGIGAVFLFLFNAITNGYPSTGEKIIPTSFADPGMGFGSSFFLIGRLLFAMAPNYNSGMGSFFFFTLTATLLTFATWQSLWFDGLDYTNPTLAHLYGFHGNADGDRFSNFMEYLFGLNPLLADTGFLTASILGGTYQLLLPLSLITLNALLVIRYSFNMSTWFTLGTGLLAAILTMRVKHYGITRQIVLLSMAIALAQAIDPRFFLEVRGEQE